MNKLVPIKMASPYREISANLSKVEIVQSRSISDGKFKVFAVYSSFKQSLI